MQNGIFMCNRTRMDLSFERCIMEHNTKESTQNVESSGAGSFGHLVLGSSGTGDRC